MRDGTRQTPVSAKAPGAEDVFPQTRAPLHAFEIEFPAIEIDVKAVRHERRVIVEINAMAVVANVTRQGPADGTQIGESNDFINLQVILDQGGVRLQRNGKGTFVLVARNRVSNNSRGER